MSLACGVACYFLFQYHSPDFMDMPPSWVFYLTSFLMFFYLILDGLDGKQARRTGSSSPLGQLFDHGCDSICCFVSHHATARGCEACEAMLRRANSHLPSFILGASISLFQLCGIFMSSTLQLGSHRSAAIVLFLHILPFYTSNWEEYCTGVMRFGAIGITEGQLLICFLLAITGYIGVDAWNTPIPLPSWLLAYSPAVLKPSFSEPMECKFILIFIGTLGVLYQVFSSSMSVWEYHTLHSEERKTKKIYNKAKRMFAHYLLFMLAGVAWVFSPSKFMQEHPRIILLTIGVLFGYQVVRDTPQNMPAAT
jgi:ethanolaminephosphotransferase